MATRRSLYLALLALLILSACNLAGAPSQEQIAQTATAEVTLPPSRTPASSGGIPTTVPVTQPTSLPTFRFPTAIVSFPTSVPPVFFPTSIPPVVFPTNTQLPVSIVIMSPVFGNVVAGNVQILGSAIHPQFLQYQVEFGPDPNPGNLWFPATSAVTSPVLNGLLGIWNTNAVQDSRYQLRLRVYLRDGTLLTTVINNIVVQNRINTPVPSPTQNIPRPIAAFTQDKASGDVPLKVQFTNQSSGTINTVAWNFGDGNSSNEVNPSHTFGTPGLYNVTLTVSGPGGSSNVSRQINVTSPTAPVAGFTQDRTGGVAPVTIQFTDQSSGNVTSYLWNFSDGSTTSERNPQHTFVTPGTYNVFLTVAGPGGSSSVTRQITVTSPVPPTMTPSNTPTSTFTLVPPTSTFTPTATLTPSPTSTGTVTPEPPTSTFTSTATFTPTATNTLTETPTETSTSVPPTATFTATATNTLSPGPVAAFTASTVPSDPLSVQFTSQSTGDAITHAWDFGDGTTSSEQNPVHTYPAGGTYTVTLTVTDNLGRSATFSGRLTVTAPVLADFAAQPSGLTVQFTDQSSGQVAQYTWDFGDGTASSEQNPLHTYVAQGTYNVTLTITGANGTSSNKTLAVTVVPPLQANFSAQVNALTVQFTNQTSGQVAQYTWDFGDQSSSNEQNPAHTYAGAGTYNVTLTVTGSDGQTNSQSQQVTVTAPVVAGFGAQANGLIVQFTDQSTGQIAQYAWNFGDNSGSQEQNPQHTYAADGTYTVTLTVTGSNGTTNSQSQQVTVAAPVQANFSAQVNGLTVQFTDRSTGQISQYTWDFGDQSGSNEQSPAHSYANAGTYNVTLTVTDPNGRTNSQSQQVTVTAPVLAGFSAQAAGLTVQFTNQSTGPVANYLWDFGDGSNSQEQNPQHTYPVAGTYSVVLSVTGMDGSADSETQQVTIAEPLQANFAAQVSGSNVQFTSQSTGPVAAYLWDFGDGSASNEPNPQHTYAAPGTYAVTLTISASDGSSNSQTQQVTIVEPLQANFAAQVSGSNVQFTDQSSGPVAAYLWDFGDGSTSNEQNPLHTYAAPGTYTVALTVASSDGQSNSQMQQVIIAQQLQANFAAQVTDRSVQFTDQSTGPVAAYLWDFGDGSASNEQNPQHTYAADGTYPVTLTISASDASSNSQTQQVTVAGQTQAPTLVDTTQILPDFGRLHDVLRAIYANGINSMGNQAAVFAVAGDSIFTQPGVLTPFADANQYNLDGNNDLQPIIDWFNSVHPSFSRASLAVNPNWTAANLLDPSQGGSSCGGEAPLACELHAAHPTLMFVSIGTTDARNGTDPATFQGMLNQIVSTIISNGTIPVLVTVPDDGSIPNTAAINEAIITVAQQNNVPLLNAARALNELPTFNLNAAPEGAGALNNGAVSQYGVNALNYNLLRVLSDARNIIFPDA